MSGLDDTSWTYRASTTTPNVLTNQDYYLNVTSASAAAVALPSGLTQQPGRIYTVYNGGAGTTTVTPATGSVDGAGSTTLVGTPHAKSFITDGTNWFTISAY